MSDRICDGAASVLRDVPVLDADWFACAVGSVVWIRGDIAYSENVRLAEELEAFVDA